MATTITPSRMPSRPDSNPFDRPSKRLWHHSAPKTVSDEGRPDQPGSRWDTWSKHLARRTEPVALGDLLPGRSWPLAWNLPDVLDGSDTAALIEALALLQKKKRPADRSWQEQLEPWLAEAADATPTMAYALECLAIAHALPRLASRISPELWWELLAHLTQAEAGASQLSLTKEPLTTEWLAGELPLTLSYLFPELRPCRDLRSGAHAALSKGLIDLLDGEGMPEASNLDLLRPLLACWTRCQAIGEHTKKNCWNGDADEQYQWLVTQALRLSRADGSQMFSSGSAGAWCADLMRAALELGGDEADHAAGAEALPGLKQAGEQYADYEMPAPGENSEWASVAVLRPDWSKSGERLALQYGDSHVQLELNCGRDMVLAGVWDFEVQFDGKRLRPTDEWEEVCWFSDDDIDCLELEISLDNDVRLQRQILMAREDRFLYLADVILGEVPGKIEYRARLPLGPGITWQAADETREGYLVSDKPRALVMPLALPEWRIDPRHGTLTADGGTLTLRQIAHGRNLCCPLFFDLYPRRLTRPRTWRQLTVAESLKVQPHDVAVGYRIQCSSDQWMIYRSLAESASRSLLGQNISCELVIGRFDREGEVEEFLEIE